MGEEQSEKGGSRLGETGSLIAGLAEGEESDEEADAKRVRIADEPEAIGANNLKLDTTAIAGRSRLPEEEKAKGTTEDDSDYDSDLATARTGASEATSVGDYFDDVADMLEDAKDEEPNDYPEELM